VSAWRSRQLGQALMGASTLSLLLFLTGVMRRSYAALALPVLAGLAAVAGLAFWIGYTMATTQWEDEAEIAGAESAQPFETAEAQTTGAEESSE